MVVMTLRWLRRDADGSGSRFCAARMRELRVCAFQTRAEGGARSRSDDGLEAREDCEEVAEGGGEAEGRRFLRNEERGQMGSVK